MPTFLLNLEGIPARDVVARARGARHGRLEPRHLLRARPLPAARLRRGRPPRLHPLQHARRGRSPARGVLASSSSRRRSAPSRADGVRQARHDRRAGLAHHPRLRQLRRHRLVARVLRTGRVGRRGRSDHGRGVRHGHQRLRHGGCLRRRAQRVARSASGSRARAPRCATGADLVEGVQPGRRGSERLRPLAPPPQAAGRAQPRAARSRASRPLPDARAGSPTPRSRRRSARSTTSCAPETMHYIGASNVAAWELVQSLWLSERDHLSRFGWVQNSYSLLERAPEAELFPALEAFGLGFTPFSPLAGGWLTGKYRRGATAPAGSRMTLRPEPYAHLVVDETFDALEAFEREAQRARRQHGRARARLAPAPPARDGGDRRSPATRAARARPRGARARADRERACGDPRAVRSRTRGSSDADPDPLARRRAPLPAARRPASTPWSRRSLRSRAASRRSRCARSSAPRARPASSG